MKKVRILFVLATILVFLSANIQVALADGVTIDISSSSGGTGYTYSGGIFTITTAGDYTITGQGYNTLAVADNIAGTVNLTLSGVTIDYYNISRIPLRIGANDSVHLILSGSNTLSARQGYSATVAGITLPSTASLTISGDGSLVAYRSGTGAGIGTTDLTAGSGGTVTIESGTVTATGGYNSGNSNSGINGTVVINGGTVTATGGQASGGGSGSGLGGSITINDGTVIAEGGHGNYGGAGIGGSCNQPAGTITINGGDITATGAPVTAYSGAGIGGGCYGGGGTITINGGHVTAVGGGDSAGIGGGKAGLGGTIKITNQNGDTYVSATGSGGAGIGCGYFISSANTTSITITGGTVIADGRNAQGSAGIGGSYFCGDNTNQTIKISGGDVTATGGQKSAGIGGAYNGGGGTVLISGGKVTATGGSQGAGIGCGYNWEAATNGGTITITGGTVNANGGNYGAGIGGGQNAAGGTITISGNADTTMVTAVGGNNGAGIGNGEDQSGTSINGNGGTIQIDGGTVTAIGGDEAAGIGGGTHSNAGTITINGGLVTATATLDAAGIGSGRYSTSSAQGANYVTINGGRVYATGSSTADIGGSYPGLSGSLNNSSWATTNTFNGGSIRAGLANYVPTHSSTDLYRLTLKVTNLDQSVLADTEVNYEVDGAAADYPAVTDELGNLYLWLPVTEEGGSTSILVKYNSKEYLATGQVPADNWSVMTAAEQTYEISPVSDVVCSDLTEGYPDDTQETKTIQITNTGTGTLKNLTAALGSGEDTYFDLSGPAGATLAPGASVDCTVKVKNGTACGQYSSTVTISADKMDDVVFHVSQSVGLIGVQFTANGSNEIVCVHYQTTIGISKWPADPQKEGYDFTGWFTDDNTQLLPDTAITGSLTVTARWKATDYNISYNLNDGVADPANPAVYTVESDDITLNNPQKTGYIFTGWTGTDTDTPSMSVTIPKGSIGNKSYTATWAANTYTVSYNANGGTGTTAASNHTYNVQKALTANGFTRAGYTFGGWATTATGSAAYTDGQSVKNLTSASNGTVQLYVVWTRIDYTITYTLNGGTVSPANPAGYTAETAGFTLRNPVKTGYTFVGWSGTGIDGNTLTVKIETGSTGNRSYTASWTSNVYTVSYNANGGTGTTAASMHTYDVLKALTANGFARAGYTFAGWATSSTGSVAYADRQSVKNLTSASNATVQLYAVWTRINYTITYTLNGGTISTANPTGYSAESSTFSLRNPTKAGYTFLGWSGTGITGTSASVTILKGSMGNRNYAANWKANTYKVTFAPQGGTVNPTSVNVTYACAYGTLPTPTRAGYTFSGWYTAINGAGMKITATSIVSITADQTLYANWTKIPSYTITATANNTNYGTVAGAGSYLSGTSITLKAVPKAGYRFVRWLEGITVTSTSAEYKFVVNKNRTLTAEFASIGITVVKAVSAGYDRIKLTWGAVSGAAAYEIYRSSASNGTYIKLGTTATLTYTDTGLVTGVTYYYKVRVQCVAAGTVTYGSLSSVQSTKPIPATPTNLVAVSASSTSLKLTWGAVSGVTKYEIYRATSNSGSFGKLPDAVLTSIIDTGLTSGKVYYYKVRAYHMEGNTKVFGQYSSVVFAKP